MTAVSFDQFDAALIEFADIERLKIDRGGFLKQGRQVDQVKLSLDDGTFFYTTNFKDQGRFELTAYSHASRDKWQSIWKRLVDKLTAVLGSENVIDDFGDLQKPRETVH